MHPQGFLIHNPTVGPEVHLAPSGPPPLGQNTDTSSSFASHVTVDLDSTDGRTRVALLALLSSFAFIALALVTFVALLSFVTFLALVTGRTLRALWSLRSCLTLGAGNTLNALSALGTSGA
jgi:hypothetical protein